jgi:Zn-dependent protease
MKLALLKALAWVLGLFAGRYKLITVCNIPVVLTGGFILFMTFLFAFPFIVLPSDKAFQIGSLQLSFITLAMIVVVLHEYGHSLMAQRLGYEVTQIEMWPLGGMAHIEGDWIVKPRDCFWTAAAGPAVNVVLFAAGGILLGVSYFYPLGSWDGPIILFMYINAIIAAFNLLPIHPMDGGRILWSFISRFQKDPVKAYDLTTYIGYGVAFAVCPLLWYFWSPFAASIIIFLVIFFGRSERVAMEVLQMETEIKQDVQTSEIFSKESELFESYKKTAEKLPEEGRKEYLEKMERFHTWMKDAFRVNCAISVDLFENKEVQLKTAKQRWNGFVNSLTKIEDWWKFYGDFVTITDNKDRIRGMKFLLMMVEKSRAEAYEKVGA